MPQATPNLNDLFFEGLYKDVWKKLIPNGLSEAEVDFIQDVGKLQPGDHVLDLLCGYGRHTLELARRGYPVTSIDNLPDYIQEINSAANAANLPVTTFLSDVLQAEFKGTYDAVICMGNSFAFFDRADLADLLLRIGAHLKPGGVFIINSWMIAEIALKHFREREWYEVDEYKYLLHYRYQFHPSRIESEHTIIRADGKIEVIKGVDYIVTLDELSQLMEPAGLRIKELYSTPRKKKFALGDNRIYIVAEKSGS